MERAARQDAYVSQQGDRFEGQDERIGFWQITAGVLLTALIVLGLVGLANLRAASLDTASAPAPVSVVQDLGSSSASVVPSN